MRVYGIGFMWSSKLYTLSEVSEMSGAKGRAVQVWTDGGVIQSTTDTDRAGRGVHRRYFEWELALTATVVPLAEFGVPIGHLRTFTTVIRPAMMQAKAVQPQQTGVTSEFKAIATAFGRALDGEGENYLCYAWGKNAQLLVVKTDQASRPACICPSKDFPKPDDVQDRIQPAFVVLDLTRLLRGRATG